MSEPTKGATPNIGLTTYPSDPPQLSFLEYRTDMSGTGSTSNMQILDREIGTVKNRCFYFLQANALVTNQYIANNESVKALVDQMLFILIPNSTNTGASSLTINGFPASEIKIYGSAGSYESLEEGDLKPGAPTLLNYNAADSCFKVISSGRSGDAVLDATTAQKGVVLLSDDPSSTSSTTVPNSLALSEVYDDLQNVLSALSGKANINHASSTNQYGTGSDTMFGHVKVYTALGDNTDGTMSQLAINNAVNAAKPTAGVGISVSGSTVSLLPAASGTLGGVKQGDNVSIAEDGTISASTSPSSLPPSGSAGGDLSGNYPNPVIGANKVTDAKIGNRTINQNITDSVASVGTVTQLLSWIVKILRGLHGEDNWYDAPSTTIKALTTTVSGKQNTITASGVLKGNGSGGVTPAVAGTDYLATETDPTVPAWAKQPTKPGYTYTEITGKPALAAVATSGSYNDLANKPSIPSAQVNADWNASSGVAQILNKPTIPTVAADVGAVPTGRTVNGKPLSANITLTSSDVGAVPTSEKGVANGIATLDANGKVTSVQVDGKLDKSGGTMTGDLISNNPAVGTSAVRNIYSGTTDMTPGVTSLPTGVVYLVHEV